MIYSKNQVIKTINREMTILYWRIGKRIQEDILKFERAEYGAKIVLNLSRQLIGEYGKGFERSNLLRMVQFYESFPDEEIVATLSRQLTWSHFLGLLPIVDKSERDFYAYMAIESGWSVRQLRSQIHQMTFARTIGKQKGDLSNLYNVSLLSPDLLLKDPYILEFLNLPEQYYESDLEKAILTEIEKFMLELGTGFAFVERQKRITIDNDHYYIDLLLYNRKLKRLVAIELKTGKFRAEYKGQMELYLGWLKNFAMVEGENNPIGIILCTEKSAQQIELLAMDQSSIHVAEYWTELPPQEVFERKIREIVKVQREYYLTKQE